VRVLNTLALVYHYADRQDEAMETYSKALKIDPNYNNGELPYNMGVSLNRVGRAQEAVESFQVS
jgi:tetratricopeptide (TPR) repeat protein